MSKSVLLVCYEYKPDLGGTAELSYQVSLSLAQLGYEVTVSARDCNGAAEFDADQPVEILRNLPPDHDSKWANLRALPAMRRYGRELKGLVRERGIQYILSTESLRFFNISGMIRARTLSGLGIPAATIFHGMDAVLVTRMHPVKRWLFRHGVAPMADFYANSQYTATALEKALGREVAPVVIGCGVRHESLPPAVNRADARKKFGLGEGPVLLTVGRLVPRKGIDTTIRALPQLADEFPGLTYVVAGGGFDLERLKQLAEESGCAARIRFEGSFTDEMLPYYYCAADLFLMPNRDIPGVSVEGFGIVFAEAGHYGLPVIGGRAGGVPEAIVEGQTGLLAEPDDPDSVASCVRKVLTDGSLREKFRAAGQVRAHTELTWDAVARRVSAQIEKTTRQ